MFSKFSKIVLFVLHYFVSIYLLEAPLQTRNFLKNRIESEILIFTFPAVSLRVVNGPETCP